MFLCLDCLKAVGKRLEVDLGQIERGRALLADGHAGDGLVEQFGDPAHHLRDVCRVWIELGADRVGDRTDAGHASGELQRGRVGFDRAIKRGRPAARARRNRAAADQARSGH